MWTKTAVHLDATSERPEGWHYAQVWSNGGGPIGYCADHEPHPTEDEARRCYGLYLCNHVQASTLGSWTDCGVEECGKPAKTGYSTRSGHVVALCEAHVDRERALLLLSLVTEDGAAAPVGDSMGS